MARGEDADRVRQDIRRELVPFLIDEDDRDALVRPVLFGTDFEGRLRWRDDAEAFTSRLVSTLPSSLLGQVLAAVRRGRDPRQAAVLGDLLHRLAAVSGPVPHTGSPVVRHRAAPVRAPGRSVVFRTGPPERELSIGDIRERWDSGEPGHQVIGIVTDFALDAEASLSGLAEGLRPVHWIDGESLLDGPASTAAGDDPVLVPPAYLMVDFSAVRPERWLATDATASGAALEHLVSWAREQGHRVALGLPRFLATVIDLDPLRRTGHLYQAATLFSPRYRHILEDTERLVPGPLPLEAVLPGLLCANSPSLPAAVAAALAATEGRWSATAADEVRRAMAVAERLTAAGFHEIAFRLETWCRTRAGRDGYIPLAVDITFDPDVVSRPPVIGYAEDACEVPAMVEEATLTGSAGSGRTTALERIEHHLSVPRPGRWDTPSRVLLPLYVPLATGDGGLVDRIDGHLRSAAFRSIVPPEQRPGSSCHELVGRIGSLRGLRRLFGSPVLLLLDDADMLAAGVRRELGAELGGLHDDLPRPGVYLAARPGRLRGSVPLPDVRLRDLGEGQIEEFIAARRGDRHLLDLVADHDRPIRQDIGNPRLLAMLCELDGAAGRLADANFATLIRCLLEQRARRFVTGLGGHRQPEWGDGWAVDEATRELAGWLPGVALRSFVDGTDDTPVTSADDQRLADGRLLGLLRPYGDGVVTFMFDQLRTFFAAQALAGSIAGSDAGTVVGPHLHRLGRADQTSGLWEDLLRMLVAVLPPPDARIVVDLLTEQGRPRLAQACAAELPPSDIGRAATATLHRRLMSGLGEPGERLADARALAGRDPRVRRPARDGLLEVPATGQSGACLLGRYPVTVIEFAGFVRDGGYDDVSLWHPEAWDWIRQQRITAPLHWRNHRLTWPNAPVTGVSYVEAAAYCAWLNRREPELTYRLPSAAEWDRAAHGGHRLFELLAAVARFEYDDRQPDRERPTASAVWNLIRRAEAWLGWRRPTEPGPPVTGPLDVASAEEELRIQVSRVRDIVSRISSDLLPRSDEWDQHSAVPVGIVGVHDFFGGCWQWCGTAITSESANGSLQRDITDGSVPATGGRIVVKGGAFSPLQSPTRLLIGGWFDPRTRFHRLGFRIAAERRPG